jgi:glutamate dehydrogenase/leucine dehydrogenase
VIVLKEIVNELYDQAHVTYALQGFGNVGQFFAKIADEDKLGWELRAVTDSKGGIASASALNVSQILLEKLNGTAIADMDSGNRIISNDTIFELDVDVLVLAALGDVITKDNYQKVKAKIILELANGPVSDNAHDALTRAGVHVVPDILANAGGVVVSYYEWLQNINNEHWSNQKINNKLTDQLTISARAIHKISHQKNIPIKDAAFVYALKRLVG